MTRLIDFIKIASCLLLVVISAKAPAQEFYGMIKVDENLWVDQTEIINNEYRSYVNWIRDSIARELLIKNGYDEFKVDFEEGVATPHYGKKYRLNWEEKIDPMHEPQMEVLDELYLEENRYFPSKKIDITQLNYRYLNDWGEEVVINVYPDTTCWVQQDSLLYMPQMANMYFWHPAYDNYPVVGLSYEQIMAFCIWRSELYNNHHSNQQHKDATGLTVKFTLPTEEEWNSIASLGKGEGKYAGRITHPTNPTTKEELWFLEVFEFLINSKENEVNLDYCPQYKDKLKKGKVKWVEKHTQNQVARTTISVLRTYRSVIESESKEYALLGLAGNVAELTFDKKILGGSWYHSVDKALIGENIQHNTSVPTAWMGFRCVVMVVE